MNRSRLAALLLFAVLAIPLWAADSGTDDLERNTRLLKLWKTDPEHYARLQRDGRLFAALPPERQEKMRRLDRELHECDSETQKRLWETLERYVAWLDQLPEAEQQQILAIADKQERITAIKAKCEQQWLERLPEKDREYLEQHPAEIARRHREDQQRRQKWLHALKLRPDLRPRPNKPKTLEEFPADVTEFVNELLTPMLSDKEKDLLKTTQGWPALAQTILELSEKHPVLPPANNIPIVKFEQLSDKDRRALLVKGKNPLAKHENHWPEFALAATDLAAQNKHILSKPLGASKPAEFPPETEAFIKDHLLPAITPVEAEHLRLTEGQWPAYPKLLHELAKKYKLVIPGMSLPGPAELWERARTAALPEVPDHELRAFVGELSHEDMRKLNLSPQDPSSRDRIRQEYFRRHPSELKRLHDLDWGKGVPRKMPRP
jgi:hypothetical protein